MGLPSPQHRQNRCPSRRQSSSAKRQSRTLNWHRRSVRHQHPRLPYPNRKTDRHAACRCEVTACSPRPPSGGCAPRRRTDFALPQRSKRNPLLPRKKKLKNDWEARRFRLPLRPLQRRGRQKKGSQLLRNRRRRGLASLLLRHHLDPAPSRATDLPRRRSPRRRHRSRGARRQRLVRHRPRCGVQVRFGECLPLRRRMRLKSWQPDERPYDPSRRTIYLAVLVPPQPFEQRHQCRHQSNRHPSSLQWQERARVALLANRECHRCTLMLVQTRCRRLRYRTPVRSLRRYPSSNLMHDPHQWLPQARRLPLLLRGLRDVDRCPFRLRR